MQGRLDLNVDVGESVDRWRSGADRQLFAIITSANICTGAYAGDDVLIAETCAASVEAGVRIGAQVGYPDREGFGRRPMEFGTAALAEEISRQLDHLTRLASDAGGTLAYVKPHGALYHRVHHDQIQAEGLLNAVIEHNPDLAIMGMPDALTLQLARERGLDVILEGFADRAYTDHGGLVSRDLPGAVLADTKDAAAQALSLVDQVDSICVHSDSPGASLLLAEVRAHLERHGIRIGTTP